MSETLIHVLTNPTALLKCQLTYIILSFALQISYDPRRYDDQSDGWRGVTATTKLFGNTFRFTLENAVDVYNTTALAPIVFLKTLQEAGKN